MGCCRKADRPGYFYGNPGVIHIGERCGVQRKGRTGWQGGRHPPHPAQGPLSWSTAAEGNSSRGYCVSSGGLGISCRAAAAA
eukprot:1145017-Pelagomonas_calceolata.AAC.3